MSNDQVGSSIPISPEEKMIVEHIKFLKEAVEEAIVREQETKDKAEGRWTGLYKLIVDLFSKNLDEPDNAPEELIKSSREAPSPLTAEIYTSHIATVAEIRSFVEQVLKSTIEKERKRSSKRCRVIQKAAIQRSRGYLKDLTDISEGMAKTLGIIPKKSTFKDRSRLLKLVSKTYRFRAAIKIALQRDPNNPMEGLVTSKDRLDRKKNSIHNIAISEDGDYDCYDYYYDDDDTEDDDEDDDDSDDSETENEEEEEKQDDKD
ncbi:hypothetical protein BASA60_004261 [Batrachochytrium salamandrivorans]|nr:hypothetical protein BASA62_001511 [Batrachochytrium salamandrivorans]KAH6577025.1 hypothetical protein BASA60_004261 [Batrachochytrium salamandrivorans]